MNAVLRKLALILTAALAVSIAHALEVTDDRGVVVHLADRNRV
jgi:hypothetical protein